MTRPLLLLAAATLAAIAPCALATQDILSASVTTANGVPSPSEGYTYQNGQQSVNSFSTATASYGVGSIANNVFVRRNSVNANQSSVWYVSSGVGTDLAGVHQNSYGPMLLNNDLLSGSDNTFANTSASAAQVGNIERIDFTWNSGLSVSNALAFAVFERGAVSVHDSFAIAAILSIDAFGNPTAYGDLLRVGGNWGATNPIADQDYRLFRYSNGDTIDATTDSTGVGRQGIGGLLITAADLGLTNGTQIYGYSLMAADVTGTNSAELLDWTNSLYYPTTTDATTGAGGIDLASLNGVAFAVVPEPATLLPLLGAGLVFAYVNCRRARRSMS